MPDKYQYKNSGIIIPNNNSDLYCYNMILLNILSDENMYKKVMRGIEKKGKLAKVQKGMKISNFLMKLHIDVRRKIFKEIHDLLGGKVRLFINGAAALDPEVEKGFNALGIKFLTVLTTCVSSSLYVSIYLYSGCELDSDSIQSWVNSFLAADIPPNTSSIDKYSI